MSGKSIQVLLLFAILDYQSLAQVILSPNVALRSHETLAITRIEMSSERTAIYLTIENRITGGNFCAGSNIYISLPDGSRKQVSSSEGIPVCPDTHRFSSIGEKLDFLLIFPPLEPATVSFNLIEDCKENCFSFYGVITDNELNMKLDKAFAQAENNEPAAALVTLTRLADEYANKNPGAAGLLYLNIVKLSEIAGNKTKEAEWYRKLVSSGLPETGLYLMHLNSQGIKF
jgi:hypothetical protein